MNVLKLLPILLIHTVIFCLNTNYSNAKSAKETWQVFSDENTEKFRHLAVDEYGRWVYIGAVNYIYQLSTDLELKINFTISELSPSDCTAPNNCSHKLKRNTTTFNENEVLVLDYQNQQLISCGTFFSGICHAHDIGNISKILTTRLDPIVERNPRFMTIAFIAPSLAMNSSTPLSTLYVGVGSTPELDKWTIKTMTIKNLKREYFSSVLIHNTVSHLTKNECSLQLSSKIIYGFSSENVGYFIVDNDDPKHLADGYLIETDTYKNNSCNKVPTVCYSGSDMTSMGNIFHAYIQNRNSDLGSKIHSHEMDEKMLFTLQTKISWGRFSATEADSVCRYQINKLHSLIQNNEPLKGDLIFTHPRSDAYVISMVVTTINNHTILFHGTNDGRLLKISIKGVDSLDTDTGYKYADIMIDPAAIVQDMQFDSTMNFLYAMTEKKIIKVKIHNCDEYKTSHACLMAKDPYCGWCFPNNTCCLKSECNIVQNQINWVSYDIDKYIDPSSSPADKFSRTAESNVTFKLIPSHPFINHTIICLFEFGNFSINTTTICNENSINCVTPTLNNLPPTPINNHTIEAWLSVQTNHLPVFQKIHVVFYNCSTYKSCSSCTTSPYPCQWYVDEFKCTDNTIWKENDTVIGMNLNSTYFPLRNSTTAYYDGYKYAKNSTFCPQFYTKHKSDIYIPAHLVQTIQIQLYLYYTIPMNLQKDRLACEFACEFACDSKVMKQNVSCEAGSFPGNGLKEGVISCEVEMILPYAESKPFITVELSILLKGSIPLDNTNNTHIVVYECARMSDQCTACLNKNYSCMWNSETRECKYYNSDDESNITDPWLRDIQKCSNSNRSANWLTENIRLLIILIVAVTFTVVAVFVIYCRISAVRSRKMQQQINKMGIEMIAISQCVKRVVIENEIELDKNESHILKLPNVNIVYEPFSTSSENETEPKNEYELLPDEKWEIPRENLVLGTFLGEGEFGRVVKGNVSGLSQQDIVTTVAVKMLKKKHSDVDMVNLVKEMELMKLIGRHDNVLSLLGCCTQDGPLLIITEYSPHGNLLDFLRNHNHELSTTAQETTSIDLSEKVLITFAQQVAKGMEYLASIKCIHRDLAARNVLVFDNYIVKIADFGLARDIQHEYYYRQKTTGKFPVKWMAPEALKHCRYTIRSDVWSYGVLLWEIMTFGTVPYFEYDDAKKLLQDIKEGYRMNKPDNCPEMLYCLMRKCWNYLPKDRPDFTTIIRELDTILATYDIVMEQTDLHSSNIATESDHEESETDSLLQKGC